MDYIQTEYSYNSAGLLTDLIYRDSEKAAISSPDSITEQYTVEYDGRGFIVSEQLDIDYETASALYKAYEFDSIGRLVKAARGDNVENVWSNWDFLTEYTYDMLGNRYSMDDGTDTFIYDYNQFNQLESVSEWIDENTTDVIESYEYDELGNQTIKNTNYSSGSPTLSVLYQYNLRSQLKYVATTDDVTSPIWGDIDLTETVNMNAYNASGQRAMKLDGTITSEYIYSGGALLYSETDGGTMLTENILDLSGRIIASTRFDDDDDVNTLNEWEGKYFFYHYDIRGSVTAIVDPDGDSVKEYTYDEFGNLCESGEATFDNEVTFTGSITDTSTGLQYMNARFYEPTTGRFLSQDSYSGDPYDPWTQHLYSYCGNNPVNMIDPTGHRAMMIGGDSYDPTAWFRNVMTNQGIVFQSPILEPVHEGDPTLDIIKTSGVPKDIVRRPSEVDPVEFVGSSIDTNISDLAEALSAIGNEMMVDVSNLDINNSDPQVVLDSNWFSMYKGTLVFNHIFYKESSASFGFMFINKNLHGRSDPAAINTILHEYGHSVQFHELGYFKYLYFVAVPSVMAYNNRDLTYEQYFSQPQEYLADRFGRVNRGGDFAYSESADSNARQYWRILTGG